MDRIGFFCKIFFILFLVFGCVSTSVQEKNQAVLEIENSTPYEVKHIYVKPAQGDEWGQDVLEDKSILPFGTSLVHIPKGLYKLKAEILVNNKIITVDDGFDFKSGKQYIWTISEESWIGKLTGNGDYGYMDTYEHLDTYGHMDTYGHLDSYEYLDSYAYLDFYEYL